MEPVIALIILFVVLFHQNVVQGSIYVDVQSIPRIMAKSELIFGNQGSRHEINRYNESTSDNKFTSVPGCPKSIDGLPWIYYGNPPRCYLAGQRGPCESSEVLAITRGSSYGTCSCDCLPIIVDTTNNNREKFRYKYCKSQKDDAVLGKIYDSKEKRCHSVGIDQGPCRNGLLVFQQKDGNSLNCIRRCEENASKEMAPQEECLAPFEALRVARSDVACDNGETYSKILSKCIRKLDFSAFRIG